MPCLLTVVGSANTPRPPSVRRQIAGKLAATPSEYAALRKQWPEFETDAALEAYLDAHDLRDPGLDGGRHRRQPGGASAWPARPPRSTRSTSWSSRAPRARPSRRLPRPSRRWWRSWSTNTSSGRRSMTDRPQQEHLGLHRAHRRPYRRRQPGADRQGPRAGRPGSATRWSGLLCGHDVDELAQDVIRHGADRVLAGRPPGARALPHASLRARRDHRGAPAPAGDLPGRRHAQRPGLRAARRQRAALRPDRRLHRPADRRLLRPARGHDLQEPALPDPAGVRRQPGRHDRQPDHAAPDGHGSRGRHAHAGRRREPDRASSRRSRPSSSRATSPSRS